MEKMYHDSPHAAQAQVVSHAARADANCWNLSPEAAAAPPNIVGHAGADDDVNF